MFHRLLAALLVAACPSVSAHAGPFDIPEENQTTFVDLGAAVVSRASYVGSEETETDVYPYLAFSWNGRAFFNPAQGLGVNAINRDGLRVAGVAYFAGGRDAEDTPFFDEAVTQAQEDAFDVDSSATVGGLVSYRFPFAQLELQSQFPVTGDVEGWRLDASLATRLVPLERMVGKGTIIAPGVRASYLSDRWTESFYGIDQAQAALISPGLAGFDPDGGINSYSVFGLTSLTISESVTLVGVVNYSMLAGDAKDSPLSPDNSALTAVVGIAKRF